MTGSAVILGGVRTPFIRAGEGMEPMSEQSSQVTVTVLNELGMHARAATQFVQLASKFDCDVGVEKDGQKVNGKSIMGVMMLAASQGTDITLITSGPDENDAVADLERLVAGRFGEPE